MYKIYRNTYENVFNGNEEQVKKISLDLDKSINALVNTKLTADEVVKRLSE